MRIGTTAERKSGISITVLQCKRNAWAVPCNHVCKSNSLTKWDLKCSSSIEKEKKTSTGRQKKKKNVDGLQSCDNNLTSS